VVVGNANDLGGDNRAFRWTASGTIDIGGLSPTDNNYASDVSADGSIIVGMSSDLPFRWTSATGMVQLPLPAGAQYGWAATISGDGSVVGGYSGIATDRATYWDAAGVHDLATVLVAAIPAGWVLQQITGISDNGRTFAGYGLHNSTREAWVATLASGCYPNCDNSTVAPILNINDFQCFINKFAAQDPYANCDGSTNPPILNVNDFQCFLNAFAAGCS
jgi:hypothetical protein